MVVITVDNSNKTKVLAWSVAAVLHGAAGLGVAQMQAKPINPPKITPPIEIELINMESPTPVPVTQAVAIEMPPVTETVAYNSAAEQLLDPVSKNSSAAIEFEATQERESVPESKMDDMNDSKVESESNSQIETDNEDKQQEDQLALQQALEARKKAEVDETRRMAEEQARLLAAQAEANRQALLKAEQEAKLKADQEKAQLLAEQNARIAAENEARLRAQQEAAEKAAQLRAQQEARAEAEREAKLKAEQTEREKADRESREREKAENEKRSSNQSLNITAASWRKAPRLGGFDPGEQCINTSIEITFTVDSSGKPSNVSLNGSTGDRKYDSYIRQQVGAARLHPHVVDGIKTAVKARFPVQLNERANASCSR